MGAILMIQGKNLVVTDEGNRLLGRFIRDYREAMSPEMRLEDLMEKIIAQTGYKTCSISTLSKFETGRMKFSADLCSVLAAVLKIKHPLEDRNYSGWDFEECARENINLSTGLPPKKRRSK